MNDFAFPTIILGIMIIASCIYAAVDSYYNGLIKKYIDEYGNISELNNLLSSVQKSYESCLNYFYKLPFRVNSLSTHGMIVGNEIRLFSGSKNQYYYRTHDKYYHTTEDCASGPCFKILGRYHVERKIPCPDCWDWDKSLFPLYYEQSKDTLWYLERIDNLCESIQSDLEKINMLLINLSSIIFDSEEEYMNFKKKSEHEISSIKHAINTLKKDYFSKISNYSIYSAVNVNSSYLPIRKFSLNHYESYGSDINREALPHNYLSLVGPDGVIYVCSYSESGKSIEYQVSFADFERISSSEYPIEELINTDNKIEIKRLTYTDNPSTEDSILRFLNFNPKDM